MRNFLNTFIFALFAFIFINNANSENLFTYNKRIAIEKLAVTNWIMNVSHEKLNRSKSEKITKSVYKYAQQHSIDPLLIIALIKQESGFRSKAHSAYGAAGLMQVVKRFHKDKIKGRDIYKPDVGIEVGIQILKDCVEKLNNKTTKALMCYSGGAGKKYYVNVQNTHKELKEQIVLTQFEMEEPIKVDYSYSNPLVENIYSSQNAKQLLVTAY